LRGVGLLNSESFNGINVSFAGGGDVNIGGHSFNESPSLNVP
jgi:hypothetical protein